MWEIEIKAFVPNFVFYKSRDKTFGKKIQTIMAIFEVPTELIYRLKVLVLLILESTTLFTYILSKDVTALYLTVYHADSHATTPPK